MVSKLERVAMLRFIIYQIVDVCIYSFCQCLER